MNTTFVEPTLANTIAIWWSWLWRTFLLAIVVMWCLSGAIAIITMAGGFHFPISPITGKPIPPKWLSITAGLVSGLGSQVWILRYMLRKKPSLGFSLRLLKSSM
jgi:hypothetical protein